VVEHEVDAVLVDMLEDDELVSVELWLTVVRVDEVLVVVELLLIVELLIVELLIVVVSIELIVDVKPVVEVETVVLDGDTVVEVVDDVVGGAEEEVVVDGTIEDELEELEPGELRTAYAPMPATATMMITMTAIKVGARPILFWSTINMFEQFYLTTGFAWVL
jgi:hypothetical protein